MRGTWALCSELGLFWQPHAVMSIDAEDRWVLLAYENGKLVPRTNRESRGRLEYLDISNGEGTPNFQLRFVNDADYMIGAPVVLSDLPRMVVIHDSDEFRYARVEPPGPHDSVGDGTVVPTDAVVRQPLGAGGCDSTGGDVWKPSNTAEQMMAFQGTWLLCSDLGLFRTPQAGVYIGPDHKYVFLEKRNGRLVLKSGLDNKGRLEFWGDQVNFVSDLERWIFVSPPLFTDDPRILTINNGGVERYKYWRVP
jgi:hypothetical protein